MREAEDRMGREVGKEREEGCTWRVECVGGIG